jgi:hypothetical protein
MGVEGKLGEATLAYLTAGEVRIERAEVFLALRRRECRRHGVQRPDGLPVRHRFPTLETGFDDAPAPQADLASEQVLRAGNAPQPVELKRVRTEVNPGEEPLLHQAQFGVSRRRPS